jgi:hypothetical protein
MSTQTWASAAHTLENVLIDTIRIYSAGEPVTVGFEVTRELTLLANGIPALVQQTNLENAVESRTSSIYAVKVSRDTVLDAGMVIEVETCYNDPSLVGKKLLLDKVSHNGMALIRKATASDFAVVNQEGKEALQ